MLTLVFQVRVEGVWLLAGGLLDQNGNKANSAFNVSMQVEIIVQVSSSAYFHGQTVNPV